MATTPESRLWQAMKKALQEHYPDVRADRIENRSGGGIPDVDISGGQGAFKVELKAPKSLKRLDMEIEKEQYTGAPDCAFLQEKGRLFAFTHRSLLRPSQRAFFVRLVTTKGVGFVLARTQNSNLLNLLVPCIYKNHLWLRESCTSEHWPEVLDAMFRLAAGVKPAV